MKNATWFDLLDAFFSPEKWVTALNDPNAVGQVFGGVLSGLIAGVLALIAGGFTFYTFLKQRKAQNNREFLAWLAKLTSTYQGNENYGKVRIALAQKRSWIRRLITMEMLCHEEIMQEDVLVEDKAFFESKSQDEIKSFLDWDFLKIFTDYLYFFEELLAFGQFIKGDSSWFDKNPDKNAKELVNHFGWFLRSMCFSWGGNKPVEQAKAAKVFIAYLATGRYRRLTEVCLCFFNDFSKDKEAEVKKISQSTLTLANSIFKEIHQEENIPAFDDLIEKWGSLVGSIGGVKH